MPVVIIDNSKRNVTEKIRSLYDQYKEKMLPSIRAETITITVCDDYVEEVYLDHTSDREDRNWLRILHSAEAGVFVSMEPKGAIALFQIYLNQALFDRENYGSTLVHELCHAEDFIQYWYQFKDSNLKDKYRSTFSFWTEFNAARTATLWYKQDLERSQGLEKIAYTLLEYARLHSFMCSKIYYLARYYAVLSILDKDRELHFDNYEFPVEAIEFEFKEYGRLLYDVISTTYKYEEFNGRKDNLKNILENINDIVPNRSYINKRLSNL